MSPGTLGLTCVLVVVTLGQIRCFVEKAIQAQAVRIEGIRGQFTGNFPKLAFHGIRELDGENSLQQRLDGEKVGIDVLQFSNHGMPLSHFFIGGYAVFHTSGFDPFLLVQLLQNTDRQGTE